jgi:hypothetical protein
MVSFAYIVFLDKTHYSVCETVASIFQLIIGNSPLALTN